MKALEIIHTRKSIRKYEKREVSDELITKVLSAGMAAPSAGNQQPWQFILIKDKKILNKIPSIHPYAAMAKDAPVAILICGDLGLEKHEGFWIQDCSAATENILLAANALGLGAVWTGVFPVQERINGFKKLLDIPEDVIPFALIPLGFPAEKRLKEDRYKAERVHHDGW